MKKLVFFITAAVLFFSACQKENVQPLSFDEINDTDTTTHTDTVTHVYDTVQNTIDTPQVHISITDVLTRTYSVAPSSPNEKTMGFEIGFMLNADGEIYFDRDQFRSIVGISDSLYSNNGIFSFVSGNYVIDNNGFYKIQKNQPQYITLSMKISRDASATAVPVHMLIENFDYRTLKNGQFKAEKLPINLKTADVMF